ncbi:asparagine synthase C-terminal domain-containing protein [Wenyingzhuangia aestuarii]|uniref:asparagine synthase C-terminal domain-containing protein n=1 Tax=Wenyingzhuangia aestuarii TaxID=1647582 RepID=UPI00143B4110|nr:asparagine synthase C-terminal domain-containing protein [Wenyingzhuangia aestuarii]NJB81969.1 asparagine synthase (glutamine-hydrolysing) [Wenyingzhuangia aestuarii]
MNNVFLKKNNGFSWYTEERISVKGYFFDSEGNYYEKDNLVSFFKKIRNIDEFLFKIKNINGCFTVLVKVAEELFIASDTSRLFPVFYTYKNGSVFVSDDILFLKEYCSLKNYDNNAIVSFLASEHTTWDTTLIKNIYQNQSNEYLVFSGGTLVKQAYFFSYAFNKATESPYSVLKTKATHVFEEAFGRLIQSIKGKQVVLPLSGGFDSRLIAVMLKKYNHENVICYTYGKKNNVEVDNSRKTAEALGYKWFFIEYSKDFMEGFLETKCFKEYVTYSGNYSSMPFLQEYFAVKHIKENHLVNQDAIFIPGHCGDFLGGSQFLSVFPESLNNETMESFIFNRRYRHHQTSVSFKEQTLPVIREKLMLFNSDYLNKEPHAVFEDYDLKEFFTKFIINSTNVYSYFGYEHRLPYWDLELLSFFRDIPFKYKKGKMLYDDVLKHSYFDAYGVNFNEELQPTVLKIQLQNIKNKVKKRVPYFMYKNKLVKNDVLNYEEVAAQMKKSMLKNGIKPKTKIKEYNEIIVQWYCLFCQGLIK